MLRQLRSHACTLAFAASLLAAPVIAQSATP